MQGSSFDSPLREGHGAITDTTRLPIPVYFIHSFEQPFCTATTCPCFVLRQEIEKLFVKIVEGKVVLEKASRLMNEKKNEESNA